jgi:hypothetical protein
VADDLLARLELGLYHLRRACLAQSVQIGHVGAPRHDVETRVECPGVLRRQLGGIRVRHQDGQEPGPIQVRVLQHGGVRGIAVDHRHAANP